MAEVIFASQLYFFHGADQVRCLDTVLPLLNWENPVRARRTWDGFLSWGRWNDQLLQAGLLSQYLVAAKHAVDFRGELRRQLSLHLATIALHSELDSPAAGWIKTFTATVNTDIRTDWMNQVCWRIRELPAAAVEHQWQRWMRSYWAGRLAGIPAELTSSKKLAMAAWVIYLTDSIRRWGRLGHGTYREPRCPLAGTSRSHRRTDHAGTSRDRRTAHPPTSRNTTALL